MTGYWELLKDPRWQRMRLDVMNRDGFACRRCANTEKTLNVHHTYYARGRKPWEYELESLICLCEDCHRATEEELVLVRRLVQVLDPADRQATIGYMRGLIALCYDRDPIPIANQSVRRGVADAFGVDPLFVAYEVAEDGTTVVDAVALGDRAADYLSNTELQVASAIATLQAWNAVKREPRADG